MEMSIGGGVKFGMPKEGGIVGAEMRAKISGKKTGK